MSSETHNDTTVCLAVGGLDPSGGAGLLADTRAFTAFGCRAVAAVTSVTFQNSAEMIGAEHQSADSVRRQILAALSEHPVNAVKTGMLPTAEIVKAVAQAIRENALPNLVIDPVISSTSGYRLIDDNALSALLNELLPLATLVTPNVPEIEQITGISIDDIDDVTAAAAILHDKGARSILIKGGHLPAAINTDANGNPVSKDLLFENGQMSVFTADLVPKTNVRGTGCTLASAIAASLARGSGLHASIAVAKEFVHDQFAEARPK